MPTKTAYYLTLSDPLPIREDADPTRFNVWGDGRIDNSLTINPRQETFVITHGYLNTGGNPSNNYTPNTWIAEIATEIRSHYPRANIIIPDWDSRNPVSYPYMPIKVDNTARELGEYLQQNQVQPGKLTLIGHSLGAQLSGLTSKYYLGAPAKTIIGLDPAGPIYETFPEQWRLSPNSAEHVVAIHSSRTFGYEFPTGDLDIYLNPDKLFHPGANHAVDNHGYSHQFYRELLRGENYGQVDQSFLLANQGFWTVDTYVGTSRPSAIAPIDLISSHFDWLLSRLGYAQSNRPISRTTQNNISDRLIAQIGADIQTIGHLLVQGEISLETWQTETAYALRKLHIQSAILGRGGSDRMTREDYLAIGRILKEEYRFLRGFAQDINNGNLTQAQFEARLRLYANRAYLSFALMQQLNYREAGYLYMQRFLDRNAAHCPDCFSYATAGIKPIGTLPLPTQQCLCRANCKCFVRYYRTAQGE